MRAGIAVSLARPSKNFTGVTYLTDEMAAKRMEFLKEVAPDTRRVAVIFNPQHFDDEVTFARRGAESLGIALTTHPINSAADLNAALLAASAGGADSLFIISSRLTGVVADRIAEYGQERRLPVIASWREFVDSGALLSYGPSSGFRGQTSGGLCAKGFEWSKACRFAYRATREIRTRDQSQDCRGAWSQRIASAARSRRRSDRINSGMSAFGT